MHIYSIGLAMYHILIARLDIEHDYMYITILIKSRINAYFIYFNKIFILDQIQINSANKTKIQISQFNNKIDQQKMDQLEQRIRRSSRLKDTSTFRQLLAYASMVRDEDQIFSFMEENKIGIGQPQFWAAKLRMLKNKCQYTEFIKVIKQINKKHELKKHPKYWLITEIQNQLQLYLQRMLRKKSKVKRSAKQYELLNYSNIQKQTRKFGKIQVYVDPDCRMQYRLEDLVQFVTNRMMEQCQIQKNFYERQINSRPLSFIGKSKERINKLTQQIFGFRQRIQTQNNIRKTGGRLSIVGRKSNKRDFEGVQTPDFKKKSFSKESRHEKKINKQNLNLLDSIQILKNARIRSISKKNCQSNEQQQQNPQFDALSRDSSYKKQKIRNSPGKSQSFFSQPDMQIGHNSLFSFGNSAQKISSSDRKQNRLSINKIKHIKDIKKRQQQKNCNQSSKDFAFIQLEQTQPQSLIQKHKKNSKQQLDLQNAIKQIQMQKYQSQTFTQIDSNKQNNILLAEQDSINLNIYGIQNIARGTQYKQRKKFKTLTKQKQSYLKNNKNSMKKQQKFQLNSSADQSSQILYKQLLLYLDQQSQHNKQTINQQSISQKNNKKRISRISQQRSYSFSQTRPRSRSNT